MQKLQIKNRKNQKIAIEINILENQKGIAFIMHGLGGKKDTIHIKTFSDAFLESGYSTIKFDTTNAYGESEGNYENATTTNYYEDLEDVINWTKTQEWYQEPFCLAGHSLGGISTALYAEEYPEKVKALAPISTVISGQLNNEAIPPKDLKERERSGWKITRSSSNPNIIKKLKWHPFKEDLFKYDLLEQIDKLTMPVLLIVGDQDNATPQKHQEILFNKLPEPKEIHIIKDAPHTFIDPEHLNEIKTIFKNWIKTLD